LSNGTKKANAKVKVKPGKRVVVAEQDWRVEDFDDDGFEETSCVLPLLRNYNHFG
jgi:hypothetical protein